MKSTPSWDTACLAWWPWREPVTARMKPRRHCWRKHTGTCTKRLAAPRGVERIEEILLSLIAIAELHRKQRRLKDARSRLEEDMDLGPPEIVPMVLRRGLQRADLD